MISGCGLGQARFGGKNYRIINCVRDNCYALHVFYVMVLSLEWMNEKQQHSSIGKWLHSTFVRHRFYCPVPEAFPDRDGPRPPGDS